MKHFICAASKDHSLFNNVLKLCNLYRKGLLKGMDKKKKNSKQSVDLPPYKLKFITNDLLVDEWNDFFGKMFENSITFKEFVDSCAETKTVHMLQAQFVQLTESGTYENAITK